MDQSPSDQAPSEAGEFTAYVASLAGELSRMAHDHGLWTLAYILEMARLEARGVAASLPPERRSQER